MGAPRWGMPPEPVGADGGPKMEDQMHFTLISNEDGGIAYDRPVMDGESISEWNSFRRSAEDHLGIILDLDSPGARIPNGTHTLYLHDDSHDIFAGSCWASIEAYATVEY